MDNDSQTKVVGVGRDVPKDVKDTSDGSGRAG